MSRAPGESLAARPILAVRDVSKMFGGIHAVDGCSLTVFPSRITGLIGPNGAGKSTLFSVIAGLYAPDSGQVYFDGQRIDGLPPHRIVRRGLVKSFQIPRELRNMTVLENLMVASPKIAGEHLRDLILRLRDIPTAEAEVIVREEEIIRIIGLLGLRDEIQINLRCGQKKLLELARAIMAQPKLVLLHEPIAGGNPTLTQKKLQGVDGLPKRGGTIFL